MIPLKNIWVFVLCAFAAAMKSAAAGADCPALVNDFEKAVAAKSLDAARRAVGDIADDIVCGERAEEFQTKYVAFLVFLADDPAASPTQRNKALAAAEESTLISGSWKTAAAIADTYFRQSERSKAFAWYEKSLSFITSRPSTPATLAEKQALLAKAGAAKSAEDESQPTRNVWLQSTRELDGKVGGMYSPGLVREVEVLSVPLPVRFFTNEARFTPEGETAVKELADAANEQEQKSLKLVGHADPRGSDQHNLDLSKRRVEAVRDRLKQLGVKARIEVSWKGSRQPFDVSVLPYKPSREESWALDRRVEWLRDGGAD